MLDRIPTELRERAQWVVWKAERRNGKPTKVPYRVFDPRTKAEVDNPQTWGTFERATAVPSADAQGSGYVFSADDPFTGIDFDDCIDLHTGELHPAAAEILAELGGYQERSPSGAGMHAIVVGKLTGDRHRTANTPWGGVFEVYDQRRFFTFTGKGGGAIVDRQAQLDALVARMLGESSRNGAGPTTDDDPGPGRPVEELLDQHPKLAEIARHEGKAPSDSSPSGWDHYLACESARCDLTRSEFAALLRHARDDDVKSRRADYVTRTWEKAQATVAADDEDPAKRISVRWGLHDDPIVSGETLGDIASGAAKVYLTTRDGRRLRFPRLGDLFDPAKHTRTASQVTRSRFGALTGKEAADIAQSIIELCGGEDVNPLQEAREWVIEFIAHAGGTVDAVKENGERKTRWEVLSEVVKVEGTLQPTGPIARRSVVIYDAEKNELWLPAGALKESSSTRKSWPDFTSDLAEIGWRHEELYARPPGSRQVKRDPIHRNFYVGRD